MTQIQHNLRNQELQELNYKLPYLLFSSGVIKYMKYEKYIGCHCFVDMSDGYLVINTNAKALKLLNRHSAENGMLVKETDKELIVTFDGGFNEFLYDKRFCKVLPT